MFQLVVVTVRFWTIPPLAAQFTTIYIGWTIFRLCAPFVGSESLIDAEI